MYPKILLFGLFICVKFVFAQRYCIHPSSTCQGNKSGATDIPYDIPTGFQRYYANTFNESKVYERSFKEKELYEIALDTIDRSTPEHNKFIYKYYGEIPGVLWLFEFQFYDMTEVANIYWQEYLHATGKLENINDGKSEDLVAMQYFTSPQFYFFPVVEISHEEAMAFCKWRTEVVTAQYNKRHGYERDSEHYTVFEYRLPSESEWIKCASFAIDTLKHPNVFKDSLIAMKINNDALQFMQQLGATIDAQKLATFNKALKKDYIVNCRRPIDFLNLSVPFYIYTKPNNQFGFYNILGNVSEMVQEKGIAKGGSFIDSYKDCNPSKRFLYDKPLKHIGFRCACSMNWPNKK